MITKKKKKKKIEIPIGLLYLIELYIWRLKRTILFIEVTVTHYFFPKIKYLIFIK